MIKKVFLMLGIAAMLASCSQNEELFSDKGNNTVQQVTFTLATDEKPQTRATTDGLRYVVAVYDEAGTTEVKQETTFENNSFTICCLRVHTSVFFGQTMAVRTMTQRT